MAVVNTRSASDPFGEGVYLQKVGLHLRGTPGRPATPPTINVFNPQGSLIGDGESVRTGGAWEQASSSLLSLPAALGRDPSQAHPPPNQTEQYLLPPLASQTTFFLSGEEGERRTEPCRPPSGQADPGKGSVWVTRAVGAGPDPPAQAAWGWWPLLLTGLGTAFGLSVLS